MTTKINGAAYSGVWAEKQVTFVKIAFFAADGTTPKDLLALVPADLYQLDGNATAVAGTTGRAGSVFGVVESVLVQALKDLEQKTTVLGISAYNASAFSVDVMLGTSQGLFATTNAGVISTGTLAVGGRAAITTVGDSTLALGTLVGVKDTVVKYNLTFVAMDGSMPAATVAAGTLEAITDGVGAGSASAPMGAAGWQPVNLF